MIKQSFTLRVLVISFLVLALPLLIDSFIFFQNSYDDTIDKAKTDLREAAHFRTFTLTEIQPIKQVLLKELIHLLNLEDQLPTTEPDHLSEQLAEAAHIGDEFELFLLNLSKGDEFKIIAASSETFVDTFFTSFRKLDRVVETGEGSFVRYIYDQEEKRYVPYVFLARVVSSNQTGEPAAILMARAEIEGQLGSLLSTAKEKNNIDFAILNADGIVFAATDANLVGNYFDPLTSVRKKEILASSQLGSRFLPPKPVPVIKGEDPPFFEFIFADQVQIAYRSFISDFGISVIAYSAKEEFFAEAVRHFLFIYSIYGVILVTGGGVTYLLSLWISRPLRQLSYLMGEVSEGNLDVRFEKQPFGFEINILGEIFNNTLVILLENIQKAEDERVKKEMYQREVAIGKQVQRSLLPSQVPKISGAEVAGTYLPANEAGGDFYGYLSRLSNAGEEILMISVADAAGKGISPCLYALSARSLFRTYARLIDNPAEILSRTNDAFTADTGDTGMFVTIFAATYHAQSKILSYYSCGHVPPIVRKVDGSLVTLEHSGVALGLQESSDFVSDSIQLASGDLVLFYTNGLTEAINDKGQSFSKKRLKQCLQRQKWTTAGQAVEGLTAELQSFTGSASQIEEVTIVALKIE
ncbi:MAG: hypothetical protein S4CHLAM2_14020 [Chlamydiales bacterium]|nr:hypothetical protein [Chlamydiales bacterium]